MSLLEKINGEIKEAMVSKDADKRDVLRSIKSRANLMLKKVILKLMMI